MTELNSEGNSNNPLYNSLVADIQKDPYSKSTWDRVVNAAKSETEKRPDQSNFYSHIPLDELIAVGERIKEKEGDRNSQYLILTQECSTGELWYDLILGHVNDKMFKPIGERLRELCPSDGYVWKEGLDIGTGTGNTIRSIAPFFSHVTGVDKLEAVLKNEKKMKRFPGNVDVIAADATRLPLLDNSIDIAVSNGLTYYFRASQLDNYVRELARVIQPGGAYFEGFISARHKNSLLPITEEEYFQNAKSILVCLIDNMVSSRGFSQEWDLRTLISLLSKSGFEYDLSEANKDGVWYLEALKV